MTDLWTVEWMTAGPNVLAIAIAMAEPLRPAVNYSAVYKSVNCHPAMYILIATCCLPNLAAVLASDS